MHFSQSALFFTSLSKFEILHLLVSVNVSRFSNRNETHAVSCSTPQAQRHPPPNPRVSHIASTPDFIAGYPTSVLRKAPQQLSPTYSYPTPSSLLSTHPKPAVLNLWSKVRLQEVREIDLKKLQLHCH